MAAGNSDSEPGFAPVNPYALARNEAAAQQVKRFYKAVSVGEAEKGYAVLLDGRPARTPQRRPLVLPTRAAADLVDEEFSAQDAVMKPGDMPVLRLVNAVIDGVADTGEAVGADVLRYASADLLFYRAEGPDELVARQAAAWDGVLAWARDELEARFYLAQGIIHVTQPDHAMAAVERAVDQETGRDAGRPFRLGALHLMTTLTGSALLALAVLAGALDAADAWAKAHVDEDFQIEQWGRDEEAEARRARRWADMQAAARLIRALAPVQA
jgi:chaperone required for assembly of F1-ATPase